MLALGKRSSQEGIIFNLRACVQSTRKATFGQSKQAQNNDFFKNSTGLSTKIVDNFGHKDMHSSNSKKKAIDLAKKNELISLVRKVAKHYAETEENFRDYLADILTKDRDVALICFRDVASQCDYMPQIRKKTGQGSTNEPPGSRDGKGEG